MPAAEAESFTSLPGRERLGIFARFLEYMGARSMRNGLSIDVTEYSATMAKLQNESLLTLYKAGVNVVAGSDAGNPLSWPFTH